MRVKGKKQEKRLLSRRNFIWSAGTLAAGASIAGGLLLESKTRAQVPPPPPWDASCDAPVSPVTKYPELVYPAEGLDPVKVGEVAGKIFGDLHCAEAPFWAIVNALGLECQIPISILTPLGHAGMLGTGCICGTLTGSLASLGLLFGRQQPGPGGPNFKIVEDITDFEMKFYTKEHWAPCCHVSVREWAKRRGTPLIKWTEEVTEEVKVGPSPRTYKPQMWRCAACVARMTSYVIRLMNMTVDIGGPLPGYEKPTFGKGPKGSFDLEPCHTCHPQGLHRQDCSYCHTERAQHGQPVAPPVEDPGGLFYIDTTQFATVEECIAYYAAYKLDDEGYLFGL